MQTRANRVVDRKYNAISVENSQGVLAITSINPADGAVLDIEEVESLFHPQATHMINFLTTVSQIERMIVRFCDALSKCMIVGYSGCDKVLA